MAETVPRSLAGKRIVITRAAAQSEELARELREMGAIPAALKRYGAHVSEVIAYKTLQPTEVDRERWERIAEGEADAVLFFSPSAVQNFAELFGAEKLLALQSKLAIIAVGPVTAKALRGVGVEHALLAADTTAASVVETLEEHFAGISNAARAGVKRG